ncbi:MAG: hypothetical protein ABJN40_13350 [Sneathiella sp.]
MAFRGRKEKKPQRATSACSKSRSYALIRRIDILIIRAMKKFVEEKIVPPLWAAILVVYLAMALMIIYIAGLWVDWGYLSETTFQTFLTGIGVLITLASLGAIFWQTGKSKKLAQNERKQTIEDREKILLESIKQIVPVYGHLLTMINEEITVSQLINVFKKLGINKMYWREDVKTLEGFDSTMIADLMNYAVSVDVFLGALAGMEQTIRIDDVYFDKGPGVPPDTVRQKMLELSVSLVAIRIKLERPKRGN